MAVIEEHPYIDENGEPYFDKVRHYSDDGKQIMQVETGKVYDEAVDIYPCPYTYVEVGETDNTENNSNEVVFDDVVAEECN